MLKSILMYAYFITLTVSATAVGMAIAYIGCYLSLFLGEVPSDVQNYLLNVSMVMGGSGGLICSAVHILEKYYPYGFTSKKRSNW